jgi:geranylgeranyl diphosphate synthase, type III
MSHPLLLTRILFFLVVLLTTALAVVLYYSPTLSLSLTIFSTPPPPPLSHASLTTSSPSYTPSPETTYLPRLLEPVDYYRKQTGKNMRKKFVQFLGTSSGIDAGLVESIATLCDHNHNASLVIDDIQDQSLQRRQQPCSHVVYGIPLSLGAAYLDIFRTLHQLPETVREYVHAHRDDYREKYGDAVVDSDRTLTTCVASDWYSTYLRHLYLCHLGQQLDIYWTHHRHIPTVDEYLYMIENKTGTLLLNSLGLLDVATGQKRMSREQFDRFTQLIRLFSVFFQIRDDYINVTDPTYWKEKGFCEDFDEKKNSYLLVLFQGSTSVTASTKKAFFDLFYRDTTTTKPFTDEEKHTLLRHFVDAGVIDATYNKLLELQRDIQQLMNLQFLFDALPFHPFDATSIVLVVEQKK